MQIGYAGSTNGMVLQGVTFDGDFSTSWSVDAPEIDIGTTATTTQLNVRSGGVLSVQGDTLSLSTAGAVTVSRVSFRSVAVSSFSSGVVCWLSCRLRREL